MARTCILRAFGLQMSRRLSLLLRLLCVASFSYIYAFIEAAALCSIVLRYTGAPIATRTCFFCFCFFCLLFIWRYLLYEYFLYHCRFHFIWRVRRTFFPSRWCFPTLSPRAGFLTSAYVKIQSNQITINSQSKYCNNNVTRKNRSCRELNPDLIRDRDEF